MRRANSEQRSWSTSSPALQLTLDPGGGRRDARRGLAARRDPRGPAGRRARACRPRERSPPTSGSRAGRSPRRTRSSRPRATSRPGAAAAPGSARSRRRRCRGARGPRPRRASARFSFHPGLPDLAAFPHAAWSSALRRGLREAPAASLGYGDPRGRPELREALADYLARVRGRRREPGADRGLRRLPARAVARRARAARRAAPGAWRWRSPASTTTTTRSSPPGSRRRRCPSTNTARAPTCSRRSAPPPPLIGPAHQFPSGALLHPERRAAALAWARAADGLVIEDDYDAELRFDRQPIGALQALDPEHVVYGGTASKTLAPGLRLGWIVLPAELLEPGARAARGGGPARPGARPDRLRGAARIRCLRASRAPHACALPRPPRPRSSRCSRERAPRITPVGIVGGPEGAARAARGRPVGRGAGRSARPRARSSCSRSAASITTASPCRTGSCWATAPSPNTRSTRASKALGELFAEALPG